MSTEGNAKLFETYAPELNLGFVSVPQGSRAASQDVLALSLPKTQSTTRSGLFTGGLKASMGVTERARAPDLMVVRTWGKSGY